MKLLGIFRFGKSDGSWRPGKKGMLLALKIAGGMFAGAVVVCVAAEWYIYSVSEGRIVEHSSSCSCFGVRMLPNIHGEP